MAWGGRPEESPLPRSQAPLGPLRLDEVAGHVALPGILGIVLAPLKREVNERPRFGGSFQQSQRRSKDGPLSCGVVGPSTLVAEREVHECRPRRLHEARDIERGRHGDGRGTGLLEGPRHQSHGLMTELSDGDQYDGVHPHSLEALK